MSVEFTTRLEPASYRRLLVTLAVFRLRLVAPILAFFAFGALAAGRTEQALFLGLSLVGMGLIVWLWASWQAHSPANQSIYDEMAFHIDAEGIRYSGETGDGLIPWYGIKRWRYMSGHYLLHISSGTFLALSTKDVNEADKGTLEALFAEKVPKGPRGPVR